uniref:RRM domain-containing protein n=1 Tax=Paramoeba aestuarina TaxID=180227 RepID=A0A7S4JJ62_9EUKA|mmetsp:Transcript_10923/g.16507  ORF Transcript_10923/g.16507 Transcript_10923/m.16507 type:complete len:300 (+) Transcript_10923:25-924(+)
MFYGIMSMKERKSVCGHNEWLRRLLNPVNFNDVSWDEITRLTCRVCFCDRSFSSDQIPDDLKIVGELIDPPKRILFVHNLRTDTSQEEIFFHLNLCCQQNHQIEKIQYTPGSKFAFVQIGDPCIAAHLVEQGEFIDSCLRSVRIAYAKSQNLLITCSLFLLIEREARSGPLGYLPITPFLVFQIFQHFTSIRKIITLGTDGVPQKQTKVLMELATCYDAENALSFGSNFRVELSGHDRLDISITSGKNEKIQCCRNAPNCMYIADETVERTLREHFPPLQRTFYFSGERSEERNCTESP